MFLPENNTRYPLVSLNPTASPFFPLQEPFLKCPTNPKYHPSKTRPSRTLYTPPSSTHYKRSPSVTNKQTHKNKKTHRQHKQHDLHGQRGHKNTAKEPHVQRRKMHTDIIQTQYKNSHRNKFNNLKTKPDVSAVTRPLKTHQHIKKLKKTQKRKKKYEKSPMRSQTISDQQQPEKRSSHHFIRQNHQDQNPVAIGPQITTNQNPIFIPQIRRKNADCYLRNHLHDRIFAVNYLGITNLNQTVTASIPPPDTHPTQHHLLPTTDDKMARTRQTISPRRSLRLQNKNPPRQSMPIRSRYEQRSRMLQDLENLLHEGILSIKNFTDHETTVLEHPSLARLRHHRANEIQNHGATIDRIARNAIEMSRSLPATLRHYHFRFLDIQFQLAMEEEKVILITTDTIKYLQEYNQIPSAPPGPPPMTMGLSQYIQSLVSNSDSETYDATNEMPSDEPTTIISGSSSSTSPAYSPTSD